MDTDGAFLSLLTCQPLSGTENELTETLEEGVIRLMEKLGGYRTSLCYDSTKNVFLLMSHWKDKKSFENFDQAAEFLHWVELINQLSIEPITREIFEIVQERAA